VGSTGTINGVSAGPPPPAGAPPTSTATQTFPMADPEPGSEPPK